MLRIRQGIYQQVSYFSKPILAVQLPKHTKEDYPIRTGIVKGKSNNRWKSRKIGTLDPTSAVRHDPLYHVCRGKQKTNTQYHFKSLVRPAQSRMGMYETASRNPPQSSASPIMALAPVNPWNPWNPSPAVFS